MESLLFLFLGVGSFFSFANALKCYDCLGFVGQGKYSKDPCVDGSLNASALHDFKDGLYCLTHNQKFKFNFPGNKATEGEVFLGTKRYVVRKNETNDLNLDGKCNTTGPGNLHFGSMEPSMEVELSEVCYCQTDGCNLGYRNDPPNLMLLSVIFTGLVGGWRLLV